MDSTSANRPANDDEDANEEEEDEVQPPNNQLSSAAAGALLFNALQQSLNGKSTNGQSRNGWQPKTSQQRSSFLDGLAAELSREQGKHTQGASTTTPSRQVGLNVNGSGAKATTCPECGKHVRKRELIFWG